MIPLQEFHFYLTTAQNQPFVIMTEIKKADSGQFSAWTSTPQGLPTDFIVDISQSPLSEMYDTALKAFEALLANIVKYAEKYNYNFTKINNPCCCELLSVEEQTNLLSQFNIDAEVIVNDPPSHKAP
ncbi:hypothetical protein [Acinetobacter sp. YH18001]|uniref:hypothetical protein n=1 Tax=Acinetobacter sp. YH18001 TaxID=2601197 RepID=UPI0015D2670B|nr:hypothetical protein [Acinetobacter sp. YH18001]